MEMSAQENGDAIKRKFEEYRTALYREGTRLIGNIALYRHLHEKMGEWLSEMNVSPAFFSITLRAIFTEIILWGEKLLIQGPSEFNIWKFLNFIEQNRETLFEDGRNITPESIQNDKERIANLGPVLESFKLRRDKYSAHFDLGYIDNPARLDEEAPIRWGDLNNIDEIISTILNKYSSAYDEHKFLFEPQNIRDVDNLLWHVRRYNEIPIERREENI
jgi:hypothetical protein